MSRPVLHVRSLSDQEQALLRRLTAKSLDARVVRRVQVVRLSAGGMAPHDIAKLLDRSWSGVRETSKSSAVRLVTIPQWAAEHAVPVL